MKFLRRNKFNNLKGEGKRILVTGGASGIGRETVIELVKRGAEVIFTARDKSRADELVNEILNKNKNAKVDYFLCNLESISSIKEFLNQFIFKYDQLDVLINNAGVLPIERSLTKDNHELNRGVNVLAVILITEKLLPCLKLTKHGRIINLSSSLHSEGEIDFDDLENERDFDRYKAYGDSKLEVIIYSRVLAKELLGTNITVNALHPGVVKTPMTLTSISKMNPILRFIYKLTLISPRRAAMNEVYLALSDDLDHVSGEYFNQTEISRPSEKATDEDKNDKIISIDRKILSL